MTVTINSGTFTVLPVMTLGYQSNRASAAVVHDIIGRPDPDVTLRPAKLRTGTLDLLFMDEAAADYCVRAHAAGLPLNYINTELPTTNMRYIVDGAIKPELDVETGRWLVHVDYREVAA